MQTADGNQRLCGVNGCMVLLCVCYCQCGLVCLSRCKILCLCNLVSKSVKVL